MTYTRYSDGNTITTKLTKSFAKCYEHVIENKRLSFSWFAIASRWKNFDNLKSNDVNSVANAVLIHRVWIWQNYDLTRAFLINLLKSGAYNAAAKQCEIYGRVECI